MEDMERIANSINRVEKKLQKGNSYIIKGKYLK